MSLALRWSPALRRAAATAHARSYQAVHDRRAANLFKVLSKTVSDQCYDGRWFDPATR